MYFYCRIIREAKVKSFSCILSFKKNPLGTCRDNRILDATK